MTPERAIGGAMIVAGILTHALARRSEERPGAPAVLRSVRSSTSPGADAAAEHVP
jgi:hypothetical protein